MKTRRALKVANEILYGQSGITNQASKYSPVEFLVKGHTQVQWKPLFLQYYMTTALPFFLKSGAPKRLYRLSAGYSRKLRHSQ